MKINEDVLAILSDCTIQDNVLILNSGQLDRKIYVAVNKILEGMGGKWNRKAKGHIFTDDAEGRLEQVLLTGEIEPPKKYGYFPTPIEVAKTVVALANIKEGMMVLEPSAGRGALVDEIPDIGVVIECIELLESNRDVLMDKDYDLVGNDFMKYDENKYDRIIMNPPFEKQQDIDHVTHAYELLKDSGRLVAIMSAGVTFRQNKKTVQFRELVNQHGHIEPLPEGTFKESGTMVNTVIVVLDK